MLILINPLFFLRNVHICLFWIFYLFCLVHFLLIILMFLFSAFYILHDINNITVWKIKQISSLITKLMSKVSGRVKCWFVILIDFKWLHNDYTVIKLSILPVSALSNIVSIFLSLFTECHFTGIVHLYLWHIHSKFINHIKHTQTYRHTLVRTCSYLCIWLTQEVMKVIQDHL